MLLLKKLNGTLLLVVNEQKAFNEKMKSPQLTAIVLLYVMFQIKVQRGMSTCGLLESNLIPLMTNSYIAHRWPWHAAIYHQNQQTTKYQCGGSVISSNSILTAAHCVSRYEVKMKTEEVSISLGRLNLNTDETSAQFFEVNFKLFVQQP